MFLLYLILLVSITCILKTMNGYFTTPEFIEWKHMVNYRQAGWKGYSKVKQIITGVNGINEHYSMHRNIREAQKIVGIYTCLVYNKLVLYTSYDGYRFRKKFLMDMVFFFLIIFYHNQKLKIWEGKKYKLIKVSN